MRVTDLMLAGAGARLNLFVPVAAIVFILVVPSREIVPPRSLQICDESESQRLGQYIKQHRRISDAPLASHLRDTVVVSHELPAASERLAAVTSACRVIDRHFPALLSPEELSRESGFGKRTVEHGFREVYGTTALNFARSLRLTRSRMALLRAKSYTPLNEIATAFGFRHTSQYSRDYQRRFSETPSMTLARI
jgi:transcriptional regulator GlxA family with amidase domain